MRNNGRCGHPPFNVEDVVRYRANYTEPKPANRTRLGVVKRCNNYDAYVLWFGRRSTDSVPVGSLVRVEATT